MPSHKLRNSSGDTLVYQDALAGISYQTVIKEYDSPLFENMTYPIANLNTIILFLKIWHILLQT